MSWHSVQTIKWSDHRKLQFPWCLALAGQSWVAAGCVCVYHSLQGVKVECEGCWTENSNVEQLIRQTFFNELSLAAWAERERLPLFSVSGQKRKSKRLDNSGLNKIREGDTFTETRAERTKKKSKTKKRKPWRWRVKVKGGKPRREYEATERAAEDSEGAGRCDLALTQGRVYGTGPILTAARDFHCKISWLDERSTCCLKLELACQPISVSHYVFGGLD